MKTELKKFNPLADFGNLHNRLNSLLPGFWGGTNGLPKLASSEKWEPAVDIEEDETRYLITVDLPDVKKEDIKVTIDDGLLKIIGQRNKKEEIEEKTFHRIERFRGTYQRSFRLPEDVQEDKMDASLEDGALKVTLPKLPTKNKPPAREIPVA